MLPAGGMAPCCFGGSAQASSCSVRTTAAGAAGIPGCTLARVPLADGAECGQSGVQALSLSLLMVLMA